MSSAEHLREGVWYHGSSSPNFVPQPFLHLGTYAQAQMRAKYVFSCDVSFLRLKRMRDTGRNKWDMKTLGQLERKEYDGVIYLNRYEGIDLAALEKAREKRKIDALSDKEFRRLLPQAEDSIIIFNPRKLRNVELAGNTPACA